MNCKHHPFDRDSDDDGNIICTNCGEIVRTHEEYYDDEEDSFESCSDCDLPDACSDFSECALKSGLRNPLNL